TLSSNTVHKEISKTEKEIQSLENKKNKLVDMRLENIIDKETYNEKYNALMQEINEKVQTREKSLSNLEEEKDIKKRLLAFKKVLEQNEVIETFDRYVFESVVDKVIVGGVDEDGNKDPAMITFVYKTGLSNSLDGEKFKPARRNAKKDNTKTSNELCSHTVNEDNKLCSHSSDDTCGKCSVVGVGIIAFMKVLILIMLICLPFANVNSLR